MVKAPGRITVQLLDNTMEAPRWSLSANLNNPRSCAADGWVFWNYYYTLRCDFPAEAVLPDSRRLLVGVSFVDFWTGRTLTASKEVAFSLASGGTWTLVNKFPCIIFCACPNKVSKP